MSGHSKWATIKHKKAAVDKARGKTFAKLARQLEVAAREGGGDPSSNASLRTVVLKAKAAQMTNDAIDRAIKRGTGEQTGASYESITYEGYAPGGVALLIDVLTDNRNRTSGDVRAVFSKHRGAPETQLTVPYIVSAILKELSSSVWSASRMEIASPASSVTFSASMSFFTWSSSSAATRSAKSTTARSLV